MGQIHVKMSCFLIFNMYFLHHLEFGTLRELQTNPKHYGILYWKLNRFLCSNIIFKKY